MTIVSNCILVNYKMAPKLEVAILSKPLLNTNQWCGFIVSYKELNNGVMISHCAVNFTYSSEMRWWIFRCVDCFWSSLLPSWPSAALHTSSCCQSF